MTRTIRSPCRVVATTTKLYRAERILLGTAPNVAQTSPSSCSTACTQPASTSGQRSAHRLGELCRYLHCGDHSAALNAWARSAMSSTTSTAGAVDRAPRPPPGDRDRRRITTGADRNPPRAHLNEHGTTADGRLFRGVRGGPLSESLYGRVWAAARAAALSPEDVASPLARRPYDLRHAAVSTWLNATGDPTRVQSGRATA